MLCQINQETHKAPKEIFKTVGKHSKKRAFTEGILEVALFTILCFN